MPIPRYPEFFNDVFGPIMQPGSSSHTAGPCRIGYLARGLLGEDLHAIHVLLDANGSFAGAFGVMAEDRAMVAGALGCLPDDERLFDAFAIAERAGISYRFEFGRITESQHPNAVKFMLAAADGRTVSLVADSTGGGMIETRVVDGYELRTVGDAYVLLVFNGDADDAEDADNADRRVSTPDDCRNKHKTDPRSPRSPRCPRPGSVGSPFLASAFERVAAGLPGLVEIGTSAGDTLYWARLSQPPDLDAIRRALPGCRVALLPPVLPVLDTPDRKPQLFDTMVRWREIAAERGLSLAETAIQYEMDASDWSRPGK